MVVRSNKIRNDYVLTDDYHLLQLANIKLVGVLIHGERGRGNRKIMVCLSGEGKGWEGEKLVGSE